MTRAVQSVALSRQMYITTNATNSLPAAPSPAGSASGYGQVPWSPATPYGAFVHKLLPPSDKCNTQMSAPGRTEPRCSASNCRLLSLNNKR